MALESGNGRSSGKCPLTSNGHHLHARRCCPHLISFCDVSNKCYRLVGCPKVAIMSDSYSLVRLGTKFWILPIASFIWSCLITFDHVWSCLIMSDHVWSCLIMSDHVWSCLIVSDHVWSCLIVSDHVWSTVAPEILASLSKGATTTTTMQNVDPAVHFMYSRVPALCTNAYFWFIEEHATTLTVVYY
jgi:hypothetical protein